MNQPLKHWCDAQYARNGATHDHPATPARSPNKSAFPSAKSADDPIASARRNLHQHLENYFDAWCASDAIGQHIACTGARRCLHVIRLATALRSQLPSPSSHLPLV